VLVYGHGETKVRLGPPWLRQYVSAACSCAVIEPVCVMLQQEQVGGHVLQFSTAEAACGCIQGLAWKLGNRFLSIPSSRPAEEKAGSFNSIGARRSVKEDTVEGSGGILQL
jgi:hypothetical protein